MSPCSDSIIESDTWLEFGGDPAQPNGPGLQGDTTSASVGNQPQMQILADS